jgi:hypothetical protein
MKTYRTWQILASVALLAILGLGMLGVWVMWLLQGNLTDGIYTMQNNSFIVCNILADAIAALLVLVGAVGLFIDQRWGHPITLIGGGMVIYAGIIGLGYTLQSDPTLTPMLIGSVAIVLICFALLWTDQAIPQSRNRHAESHTR